MQRNAGTPGNQKQVTVRLGTRVQALNTIVSLASGSPVRVKLAV